MEIQGTQVRVAVAAESEQGSGGPRTAGGRGFGQDDPLMRGMPLWKRLPDQMHLPKDGAQVVVHIVGDATGQGAQGLQPLAVLELFLEGVPLPDFRMGPLQGLALGPNSGASSDTVQTDSIVESAYSQVPLNVMISQLNNNRLANVT